MLAGARATSGGREPDQPFLRDPLPAPETPDTIELNDVVRFVQNPISAFLRQRLDVSLGDWSTELEDAIPVDLDPLESWSVGDRLVRALVAGVDCGVAAEAEVARGTLPPGRLTAPTLGEILPVAERIANEARAAAAGPLESVDVRVHLRDGRTLSGAIANVGPDVVRTVTYSRVAPKHRLCAWVQLLVLTAARPETEFRAVTVGRGQRDRVAIWTIHPLGDDTTARRDAAMQQLSALLDLHARGMRSPLPLPCKTAEAYARAVHRGRDPTWAARKEWESEWKRDKEDKEAEHLLVFGGQITFDELRALEPAPDEGGEEWGDDPSRLGRCARRLWHGLLTREEMVER
jgi:exodeoxyribonuclease V gamma subunit